MFVYIFVLCNNKYVECGNGGEFDQLWCLE